MNYARIDNEGIVREIIPEFDPTFPGIPITERFHKSIVDTLVEIPAGLDVEEQWAYSEETGFVAPVTPEPMVPEESSDISEEEATQAYKEGVNSAE